MLLDGAILLQHLRINLPGLLFGARTHLLQRGRILLELHVVLLLELIKLLLGLGGTDANLALLAILDLGVLAHLAQFLLIAGQVVHQLLHGFHARVGFLFGRGRIALELFHQAGQNLLKALRVVAHGLQSIRHGRNVALQLLHVVLLIHQKIALLEQLLALFRLANLCLELVGFHIHLHELPQFFQLHNSSSNSTGTSPLHSHALVHSILHHPGRFVKHPPES